MTGRKILKLFPILIIAVIIIIFFINYIKFHSAVNQLQKEGFAITFNEFTDKYYRAVPSDQNAAEIFKKAKKLYHEPPNHKIIIVNGCATSPWLDQKITPILLPPAKKHISENIDFFKEVKQLNKYNFVRFNYNWGTLGFPSPDSIITQIIRCYGLKTELAINENEPQEVNILLKKMFHISMLSSQSPEFIGQLTSYSCNAIAIYRLSRYMNAFDPSREELQYFYKIIDKHEELIPGGWEKAWKLNLVSCLRAKDIMFSTFSKKSKFEQFCGILVSPFMYYLPGFSKDTILATKLIKELIKTPLDNYSKRKDSLQGIKYIKLNSPFLMLIDINGCLDRYISSIRIIALLRCAKTACAVELYKRKYGKLPENLKKLVPEFMPSIPVDPFDGKELRYFHGDFKVKYSTPIIPDDKLDDNSKHLEDKYHVESKSGFYVYSIGENLKADKSEPLYRDYKDIKFIVIKK